MTTNFKRLHSSPSGNEASASKKIKVQSIEDSNENYNTNRSDTLIMKNNTMDKEAGLITNNPLSKNFHAPLAEKMRPTELSSYIGQAHIIGPESLLYNLLTNGKIPSMILWGPPGCGKTSLVNVIMQESKKFSSNPVKFMKLSATSASIDDVRKAVTEAETLIKQGKRTVVFMDEIHRFNKLQQDIFLPHVEAGTFILIGATTENPSSSLNSALLSRCRVFVLKKLNKNDLVLILSKAIKSMDGKIILKTDKIEKENSNVKFLIENEIVDWLAEVCDGDARKALGGVEAAIKFKTNANSTSKPVIINSNDIKKCLKEAQSFADKTDNLNQMYNALHHSIIGGDDNATLYWLVRIMEIKEDPVCIAKRLIKIASENISINDEFALSTALNTLHACQMIGMPECDVILTQCAVYLARAEKSTEVPKAFAKVVNTIDNHKGPQPKVPLFIKDTSAQKKLRATLGKNFKNVVRVENHNKSHLPEGLENMNFFDNDSSD